MTLDAYKALYESSVSFGVRKQLQAEEGLPELAATLAELNEKKALAEVRVLALKSKVRARAGAAGAVSFLLPCARALVHTALTHTTRTRYCSWTWASGASRKSGRWTKSGGRRSWRTSSTRASTWRAS